MTNKQAHRVHSVSTPVHEAFSWAPDMVIYHDKCADGIVAAWACWKRWGDTPEYRAANYGFQPPEDVAGKNVLIVDFSYPAADLRSMVAADCKSIVILDHHKTAQAALHEFAVGEYRDAGSVDDVAAILDDLEQFGFDPVVPFFDMDRSGARMAWDFAHPGTRVPQLVQLAERYDLWRFQPGTRDAAEALHLSIQAQPMTIANMNMIHAEFQQGGEPIIRGQAILAWRQQLVEEIASRAHRCTLAGIDGVISVECPYSLVSAVGHYLLDQHPDAPFAAMSVTGEKAATWSLRSRDDRTDVSAVAKGQGGGGHRNAAGFRIELPAVPAEPASDPCNLVRALRAIVTLRRHSREDDADNALTMQDMAEAALVKFEKTLAGPGADQHPAADDKIQAVAEGVANIVGSPYEDWRHFTGEAKAILARLETAAEPAGEEPGHQIYSYEWGGAPSIGVRALNLARSLAKAEFRPDLDRCVDEAKAIMSGGPVQIAFPTTLSNPDRLVEALRDFGTDYMTSEAHHPGYVLIPTEQFDRIRAALSAPALDGEKGE